VFVRLTPGRYGAADFLTQGTPRLDTPDNSNPQYLNGPHAEFTPT